MGRFVLLMGLSTLVACSCHDATNKEGGEADNGPSTGGESAETTDGEGSGARELGTVDFATSCSDQVEDDFNQAMALFHHMMYAQAEEKFSHIAEADPECAMAHWGIVMTLFHPLWPDVTTPEQAERGLEELGQARKLAAEATDREKALIDAAEAYFEDFEQHDEPARLTKFEQAMAEAHEAHPDDIDIEAIYALARTSAAPQMGDDFSEQEEAGQMLADLFNDHPEHPGVLHYGIHAHDYPPLVEGGLPFANAYDKIAPDVPHALHMPSHIHVRLGHWDKTIDWNVRSKAAAAEQKVDGAMSLHYVHAVDYLAYTYLQTAQDQKVRELLAEVESHDAYQEHLVSAYGIAASKARYALERKQWAEAAELDLSETSTNITWDDFPPVEAVAIFANGLGAARAGDLDEAERSHAKLETLAEKLAKAAEEDRELGYWANRAASQRDTVGAWIAHTQGSDRQAVKLMKTAADRSEDTGKNPVMPGRVLPERELLGDLLLELEQPEDALSAYQASLEATPNRLNSLYGAGKAAELAGDEQEAKRYYEQVVEITSDGNGERETVAAAAEFLADG